MEQLENLKKEEIFSFGESRLKELEIDIRKAMAKNLIENFTDAASSSGKQRKLKKNLARVLTRKTELNRKVKVKS